MQEYEADVFLLSQSQLWQWQQKQINSRTGGNKPSTSLCFISQYKGKLANKKDFQSSDYPTLGWIYPKVQRDKDQGGGRVTPPKLLDSN